MPPDIDHAGNSKHLSLTFYRSYTSCKFGSLTVNTLQTHQFLKVGLAVFRSYLDQIEIQTNKEYKHERYQNTHHSEISYDSLH